MKVDQGLSTFGVSWPRDDSCYRPRDIVRSFTSYSIHTPVIATRKRNTTFDLEMEGSESRTAFVKLGGRRGAGGEVDRGYRGVSADCRRPINDVVNNKLIIHNRNTQVTSRSITYNICYLYYTQNTHYSRVCWKHANTVSVEVCFSTAHLHCPG